MTIFKTALFITVMGIFTPSYAQVALPKFYHHPVEGRDVFTGTPQPIDLSSYPGAKAYRTKLSEGARLGPNFAGHYTVVTIGCGAQCQENWLIDAQTGKILLKFNS